MSLKLKTCKSINLRTVFKKDEILDLVISFLEVKI